MMTSQILKMMHRGSIKPICNWPIIFMGRNSLDCPNCFQRQPYSVEAAQIIFADNWNSLVHHQSGSPPTTGKQQIQVLYIACDLPILIKMFNYLFVINWRSNQMNPSHHCQQHLKGLLNSWATAFYKLAHQSMTGNLNTD